MRPETNPYAVSTLSEDSATDPIYFGGTLTRDDLLISLRDSAPRTRGSLVHYPLRLLLISALMWVLISNDPPWRAELGSISWPLMAYPLLPLWLWLARLIAPAHRRRRRRLEESAKHCTPHHGWIDQNHFVIYDASMFLRARWRFFGPALLFETHLLLPIAADSTYRNVLPIRFFSSPIDVKQGIDLVDDQCGFLIKRPPKDGKLPELVQSATNEPVPYRIDETMAWNATNWPFKSTEEGEQVFSLYLATHQTGIFLIRAALNIMRFGLWYFLPIWVTSFGWLIINVFATGGWSFLFDQIASTLIVIVPAASILTFFTYSAATRILQIRRSQSQSFLIQLRQAGIHLTHEHFESWFQWSAVDQVIVRENLAGWILKENQDRVEFAKSCFESDHDFLRFKTALEHFGHTNPGEQTAADGAI